MSAKATGRIRVGFGSFLMVALTTLLVGGCAGAESDGPADGSAEPSPTMAPESGETEEGSESSTGQNTGDGSEERPTGPGEDGTDPNGPDLQLFTVPVCEVIPGGALSGADVLTMFVAIRNGGPGEFSGLAPVTIVSDTGLEASINAGISTGSSFNGLQVELSERDYDQTHRFTITVDPDEETLERDESNNELEITVNLPDRPDDAVDIDCSSP